MDIIHPDYQPDENFDSYWSKFGNVRFESSHFVEWLLSHKQTFSTTISKSNENIGFWRWAKTNIAGNERIGELKFLPVITCLYYQIAVIVTLLMPLKTHSKH